MNGAMDKAVSDLVGHRIDALIGIAVAAACSAWWLGCSRLAIEHGQDASRCAGQVLQLLWLARAIALALQGPRAGAARGWRPAAAGALLIVAPALPLVVLGWSASVDVAARVLAAEASLWLAAGALPAVGALLRRPARAGSGSERALELAATAVAVALAAALWRWPGPL
ncbi:MAG: hypothetical protein KGN16_00485 [Burkholderiales bacterium]|nr:hypothetical protein [Burkholderiales bacterium]